MVIQQENRGKNAHYRVVPCIISKICCITFIYIYSVNISAQTVSEIRYGTTFLSKMDFQIDSLPLYPFSFALKGLNVEQFTLDYVTARLYLSDSSCLEKTISYQYRVFLFPLNKSHFRKDTALIHRGIFPHLNKIVPIQANTSFSDFMSQELSLISSGSISRGFTMGNNQDMALNSSLNLSIAGKLSEDVEINAHITDKNLPLQAEGSSQLLQEFDKIFIQLKYRNQWFVNAGDIEVMSPQNSYFMNIHKQILGLKILSKQSINQHKETSIDSSKNNEFSLPTGVEGWVQASNTIINEVGGGISKGKFARQQLNLQNGIQGPYRLTIEDVNANLIILSGSERVYLDGKLLARGQENDYNIDYNLGEITFTSKILITKEKRIIVEFEYKNENYSHFSLYSYNEFKHEKWHQLRINVHFIHDQDQKNRSIQPLLNDEQKRFLAYLGDNISNANYYSMDSIPYNHYEILYNQIDTMIEGLSYRIFVHSTDETKTLYRLRFTLVEMGQGNYVLEKSTANGRVFRWVAPLNGTPQGNYEPMIRLASPKLTELGILAFHWENKKNTALNAEFAFSNHDINTFSEQDDKDNIGLAFKLFGENTWKWKQNKTKPWFWKNRVDYAFIHKNFYTEERYRDLEFNRDYNYQENSTISATENHLDFLSTIHNRQNIDMNYLFSFFNKYKIFNALRNQLGAKLRFGNFQLNSKTSFLSTQDSYNITRFLQSNQEILQTFQKLELGIMNKSEYNLFKDRQNDSLRTNSYAWNEARIYLKNNDSLHTKYQLNLLNRLDYHIYNQEFKLQTMGNEVNTSVELTQFQNQRFRLNAAYRNIAIQDSNRRFSPEHFFTGSVEYNGRFFKNSLIISTFYEAGRGLEQKKNFSYLKVANGQGAYVWNDYNHNGIEELNEFEPAIYQDQANYIKVWTTTTDFIPTSNTQFSQNIQLRPANLWGNQQGFKHFLARFSNSTTLKTAIKNTLQQQWAAFNPFLFHAADTELVSTSLNFINNFSFNQLSSLWGIDYFIRWNQNKELLYHGFEKNTIQNHELMIRVNPIKLLSLKLNYIYTTQQNSSDFMSNKNYLLQEHSLKPILQFNNKNIFSSLSYQYKSKKNRANIEYAWVHQGSLDINYKLKKSGLLTLQVQMIHIQSNILENSTISYNMLEGLHTGSNWLWEVKWQMNITEYLQIDLAYNGRASQNRKVVHLGNLQLKMVF